MASLDRALNLVVDVTLADGSKGHVHAMPISREVFEQHFEILSKTTAKVFGDDHNVISGPRIAALLLKKLAIASGEWDTPGGAQGLLAEIVRLANVAAPTGQGWRTLQLQEAFDQNIIDAEGRGELLNALVFFTSVSSVFPRARVLRTLDGMASLWGTHTTRSSLTEYLGSLPTSTATASSGEKAASSVPT